MRRFQALFSTQFIMFKFKELDIHLILLIHLGMKIGGIKYVPKLNSILD